jgi:hypothetical protein
VTSAHPRLWRVVLSQALVALTAWISLAPALHAAGDDPDCNPVIVLHDSSQHRLTNGSGGVDASPSADHCLACHLFRSSRNTVTWKFVPQGLDDCTLIVAVARHIISTRAALPLPARAPPSLI